MRFSLLQYMYNLNISYPATCELCGQWMPRHSVSSILQFDHLTYALCG